MSRIISATVFCAFTKLDISGIKIFIMMMIVKV